MITVHHYQWEGTGSLRHIRIRRSNHFRFSYILITSAYCIKTRPSFSTSENGGIQILRFQSQQKSLIARCLQEVNACGWIDNWRVVKYSFTQKASSLKKTLLFVEKAFIQWAHEYGQSSFQNTIKYSHRHLIEISFHFFCFSRLELLWWKVLMRLSLSDCTVNSKEYY